MSKLVRLVSSDGRRFDAPIEDCRESEYIRFLLEMSCAEDLPVVEFPTIRGEVLEIIVEFMREFRTEPFARPLPIMLPKGDLSVIFRSYYSNFLEALRPRPFIIANTSAEISVNYLEVWRAAKRLNLVSLVELIQLLFVRSIGEPACKSKCPIHLSPNGRQVVSGFNDCTIKVWDVSSGSSVCNLIGHKDYISSVFVTPDGCHIVSGSNDTTIKVWDMSSGSLLRTLEGHSDSVSTVCVSLDGRRIVSGSWDKTIMVWETEIIWVNDFIFS